MLRVHVDFKAVQQLPKPAGRRALDRGSALSHFHLQFVAVQIVEGRCQVDEVAPYNHFGRYTRCCSC